MYLIYINMVPRKMAFLYLVNFISILIYSLTLAWLIKRKACFNCMIVGMCNDLLAVRNIRHGM